MSFQRTSTYETLESRCLAVGIQDAIELWWKLNLLRTLASDGLPRIGLTSSNLTRRTLPPLAWNQALAESSRDHAEEMSVHNYFAHQSAVDGRWPNQMVRDAGYPLPPSLSDGRNDVETILAGERFSEVDDVLLAMLANSTAQAQLFPDNNSGALTTEIGIGNGSNEASTFDHYWSTHVAGRHQGERFITGVAYSDQNGNRNFDAGEGTAGIRVRTGELETITDSNGVYSLPVAGGRHVITFHDQQQQPLNKTMISVNDRSVAVDLRLNDANLEVNYRIRSWWTNADNHVDVNRDRFVNPIDALIIINHLNRSGTRSFGTPAENEAYMQHAVDTNGDSNLNATDALVVINYLNRR